MKAWLITLLVCFVTYEITEHLILPMIWMIRYRRRKSACGTFAMIGKRCVVKQWSGTRGKVWAGGELWNASSESPLIPGDETVIQNVKGLTLMVSHSVKLRTNKGHTNDS